MTRKITIFNSVAGLNTVADPTKLKVGKVAELSAASNVVVEEGQVSARKGTTQKISGTGYHSLYPVDDYALAVRNLSLVTIDHGYGTTPIQTLLSTGQMSYARAKDTVFYSNGVDTGYVLNRTAYVWEAGAYVGPDTTRTFDSPPPGDLLCLYNGRIYIASEIKDASGEAHYVIWYTEPSAYSWVDMAENYLLQESKVVTLTALPDSLIVGTKRGIIALIGSGPEAFVERKLTSSPVVARSAVKLQADTIGDGRMSGDVVLLSTHDGICLVGPQGYYKNMTYKKIKMPSFPTGPAAIIENRYLCCMTT